MYLLVLVQADEISSQSVLLSLFSYALGYGLSLTFLRPIQHQKPRLYFTRHAGKVRNKAIS